MLHSVILIRGARQHNLQNLSLEIPQQQLIVVTGPSGSGKSSLAFHTLFAEGQRRFVESLSLYARQFINQLDKPDVDAIENLSPAIAIEQHRGGLNPRSTVATTTELYDYLRVLWAAIGIPHDPKTGDPLQRMNAEDIVHALTQHPEHTKVILLAPVPAEETRQPDRLLADIRRQGFVRLRIDGQLTDLDEAAAAWPDDPCRVEIVIDRIVVRPGIESRLADSIETALRICPRETRALTQSPDAEDWNEHIFPTSYRNPKTGFSIAELTPRHFSFNSHLGACPACEGLGTETFADPAKIIRHPDQPILDSPITGWWKKGSAREKQATRELEAVLHMFQLPRHTSLNDLPDDARQLLFFGGQLDTGWKLGPDKKTQLKAFAGWCHEAEKKLPAARSEAAKRRLLRVMSQRPCRVCHGHRLKPEILAVKVPGNPPLGIQAFCQLSVEDALTWLDSITLPDERAAACQALLNPLRERLGFLRNVGLSYLSLSRSSGSLSGGEAQRIRLATQLGSGLTGVLYVLDEPSIGLHPSDTHRLIRVLRDLRDRGNTVVVVEHDEAIIRAADWLVELGPGAGTHGGQLLANGPLPTLPKSSPTVKWLAQTRRLPTPPKNPQPLIDHNLTIHGAREHNLQDLSITIPLGQLVGLTGPSGSGKSTLAHDILMKAMRRHLSGSDDPPGDHVSITGLDQIDKAILIDQSPIGRSPRSNPATFTGVFDEIRALFAKLPLARQRGYSAGRFSFNTRGGRCERCEGAGRLKLEMNFLPDAWVECQACHGRRYNRETLEVTYKGLHIAEILDLSIARALDLFQNIPKITPILQTLDQLGLGYLALGQPAHTLSGGEAQRLKLAVELARPHSSHTFYLLDEPTTGLHFGDVEKLLHALMNLRDAGHSILVIEHHLDVIAACDHLIDLGPGGGRHGGQLVATGSPQDLINHPDSPTGHALAQHFAAK